MTERAQAAQRLWRELIQACTSAAAGGLDTDDLGYVVSSSAWPCSRSTSRQRSSSGM